MAISVNFSPTPTAIAGYTPQNLPLAPINWEADWKPLQSKSPNELTLVNLKSTYDRPEKIRFTWTEIPDVYKNTQISATVQAPSKRGIKLYWQYRAIASVTDATVPDFRIDFPVESHGVLTIPSNGYMTELDVSTHLGHLAACLFPTGSNATTWLAGALRGSLSK